MKKTGISLIVILLIGIYVVKENNLPNLDPETDVTQSNVLIKKPNWIITNKTSKNVYEISSYEAKQSDFEDVFFIKDPFFKTTSNNIKRNEGTSKEAILETSQKKLTMKSNVHLKLLKDKDVLELFTESIDFDLKNNFASSKSAVELKSNFFFLRGKEFELIEGKKGEFSLSFIKADLEQKKEGKYQKFGRADTIILGDSSNILIMLGSAKISLDSMIIEADEIKYNYKDKVILSSKNPKLVNKT